MRPSAVEFDDQFPQAVSNIAVAARAAAVVGGVALTPWQPMGTLDIVEIAAF
jgi:hypothetical protein